MTDGFGGFVLFLFLFLEVPIGEHFCCLGPMVRQNTMGGSAWQTKDVYLKVRTRKEERGTGPHYNPRRDALDA